MREMGDRIVVPYAEFVARRHRLLRIRAELQLLAAAQTIEGEVLHVHTREVSATDQESSEVSTPIDSCGTQQNEERHCDVVVLTARPAVASSDCSLSISYFLRLQSGGALISTISTSSAFMIQ
jgi:hypothetical protein